MAARSPGAVTGAVAAITTSYLAVRLDRAELVDGPVRRRLARHHGPHADRVVGAVTDLGSIYALAGMSTALAGVGRRRAAADIAVAGGVAWTAAQAAKPLLKRHRPYDHGDTPRLVAEPAGTSWPSGHAALAAATAGALARSAGPSGEVGLWTAVAGLGLSRCYVGVHHVTDVLAGVGVGVLSERLAHHLAQRLGQRVARALRRR